MSIATSRRRRWQSSRRPVRRVSGECESAADGHRVRDRWPLAPSGLFAAAIVLALLAFGATIAACSNAALGGVLLFVALRIIRLNQIVAIYRQSFGEFLLIVATAAAIIVLPIEQGVAVGIALSLLHGIWSTTRARLIQFDRVPDTTIWWPANPNMPGERNPNIDVVSLKATLSFVNQHNFRADVLNVVKTSRPRLLVLEASGILRSTSPRRRSCSI
jgi:MFS superfamily sulfate permease-like transporter